jgi:hypothetical protein
MGNSPDRPLTTRAEVIEADKVAAANMRVNDAARRLAQLIGRQLAREQFERETPKSFRPTKPERCRQS